MSEIESSLSPQYPGDDTRPTSKREITGWYSYGWAAEVFVVCAMGKLSRLEESTYTFPWRPDFAR